MLNIEKMLIAGFSNALAQEAVTHPELIPAEMHAALSDGESEVPENGPAIDPVVIPAQVEVLEDEAELPPVEILEDEEAEVPAEVLEVKLGKKK